VRGPFSATSRREAARTRYRQVFDATIERFSLVTYQAVIGKYRLTSLLSSSDQAEDALGDGRRALQRGLVWRISGACAWTGLCRVLAGCRWELHNAASQSLLVVQRRRWRSFDFHDHTLYALSHATHDGLLRSLVLLITLLHGSGGMTMPASQMWSEPKHSYVPLAALARKSRYASGVTMSLARSVTSHMRDSSHRVHMVSSTPVSRQRA